MKVIGLLNITAYLAQNFNFKIDRSYLAEVLQSKEYLDAPRKQLQRGTNEHRTYKIRELLNKIEGNAKAKANTSVDDNSWIDEIDEFDWEAESEYFESIEADYPEYDIDSTEDGIRTYEEYKADLDRQAARDSYKTVVKDAVKEAIEETVPEWKTKKYTSKSSGLDAKDWLSIMLLLFVPLLSLQSLFQRAHFDAAFKILLVSIVIGSVFAVIGYWLRRSA